MVYIILNKRDKARKVNIEGGVTRNGFQGFSR
nr:MAG TPA: hypothetical protein [Inoviridae sp.]